jgi:protein-tyrosine phosphatase
MAARPRGGEWLEDELADWKSQGIETVVSLLERGEEQDLELTNEGSVARVRGMIFRSFPIADRHVPESEGAVAQLIEELAAELAAGRSLVLHCRQGIGRTGLVAAGVMVARGIDPGAAIERLSAARGISIPETPAQRRWIEHFAEKLAPAR